MAKKTGFAPKIKAAIPKKKAQTPPVAAEAPRKQPVAEAPRKQSTALETFPTSYVVIDYPQENEVITHPSYAIRIGASGNGVVEVSIDGGEWNYCRYALGFWWFDWANYPGGTHRIIARLRDNDGKEILKSKARKSTYKA